MKLKIAPIFSMLCLCFLPFAKAGTIPLTVNFSFLRSEAGAVTSDEANVTGDAWIFVLDHSGSMKEDDATVDAELAGGTSSRKMTRWNALLLALKATLDQIEPGSVVKIVSVGGSQAELVTGQRGVVIRGAADREKLYEYVRGWGRPYGLTPLYQGLYLACQEAQRYIRTENRNACIVVFSDGKDESNNRYTQKDIDSFKKLFDEAGFNACLNWVSQSRRTSDLPPPPFGPKYVWAQPAKDNLIPVICHVRPRATAISLKNPMAAGFAKISAPYDFALSQKRWENLLAEGLDINVGLRTPKGEDIGGEIVHLSKGSTACEVVFPIDDAHFAGGKAAAFELSLALPTGVKGCRFIQPRTVRVSFEEQGAVTLSSVKPDSGIVTKVGESISFSASGTEGASYSWTFGDGAKATGARVIHAFAAPAPKGVSFSVSAEKPSLAPAIHSGTIVVVEAGVKMDAPPAGIKVGDTAVFTCRGQGEVASYDWFVDGRPVVGADAKDGSSSRLSHRFEKAGGHTVRVRANMKRVSPEETADVKFDVAPAPYAVIVKPEPNERFDAEAVIPFEAAVEGEFTSGVWTIHDANGKQVGAPIPSPVIDKAAKGNFPVPEAGGTFTVSFTAGKDGVTVDAAPVPFSAKAKNVQLDVVSPKKKDHVTTDTPFPLEAETAGLSGSVVFFLVDESSGMETRLIEAKIPPSGKTSASHVFPAKDGQGERAIAAKTADGKIVSDPITFFLETQADIVLKSPANNAQVPYGDSLAFEAEVSGAVKAREIQWFLRPVGGVEEKIADGTGAKYVHIFAALANRKSLTYEVYARAPLPDGAEIETDHVFVRAFCPAIQASIVQPQVNGVVLASIGKQVDYTVSLKVAEGEDVSDVVWDMGDGAAYTNLTSVKHTYRDYGTYEIKASGRCAKCGEAFSVKAPSRLVVEKQPINASFAIRASATSPKTISGMIAQGRQITLIGQTSADIAKREWTCNGQIILGDDGKPKQGPSIEYRCKDVGEYVFGLTVYDDAGSSVGPEKHALRTYRLWAILLIAFVCLMIWGVLVWYWKGDDPRFWSILVRLDRKRDTSFTNLKESQKRPLKISVGDFWNTAGNVATIPMRILTRNLRDAGNWKKTGLGDGEITISSVIKNDKPIAVVQKLHGDFSVTVEDKADPGVFRLVSDTPEDPPVVLEIKQNIGDKTHVLYMVLSFVGLSLAAAGLIAWLAF